ncbi:MAG: hypothetical protein HFK06_03815 [Clostridia bacterium]|nr:hypothetical protein [Clostridia bacterium]
MFEFLSPDFEKLKEFGFAETKDIYSYATEILDGQFSLRVDISRTDNEVKTRLTDLSTGEPYTLHLVKEAGGAFVGEVRTGYERALREIAEKCFVRDVFKGDCAHAVIEYVRKTYGDELEYLWKTFPSNAVWRRKDSKKWYGILLTVSKRKLGLPSDELVTVIDLRYDPAALTGLLDGQRYFPGYHMNKKSWYTICLDGSVSVAEICERIDKSYRLA